MNKKVFMLLACLCLVLSAHADPITREQAQQKAEQYLQNKQGSRRLSPITNTRKLAPTRKRTALLTVNELYYVFNRGDNEGYVIVAGDDKVDGVLGYTDSGEFDYEQLPCNMQYWLDKHAEYVAYLQKTPSAAPKKVTIHTTIEPMVTTKWNQGDPYNQECPQYFTLGRSITGCVATAMAQVLYYQRDKSVTETQAAMPAYTTWTSHETFGNLSVEGIPAGSPIDWDNMLDSYGNGATSIQKKAVAQLMHYCGVAVHMDYTNSSSGAQSNEVDDAFNNYFGYDGAARYVYSGSYNDDTWDDLLYKELTQGRPFYLSGQNESGGHAFVADGYKEGCYHINWGWGGQSDGYYALNKMTPGSQGLGGSDGGYAAGQEAVIGCEPKDYSSKALPIANAVVKKLCLENWDADNNGTFTYGEAAAVTDLGSVFKGQRFSTFAELYYFTGLTTISDDAFNGCTSLSTIKMPKKLKRIGARAFNGCLALKEVVLPEGVTEIGESAFCGCKKLTDMDIPSGVTRIENHSFENCQAFEAVELPNCVLYIGEQAFSGCTKLTSMTVKSVTPQSIELGANVFEGVSVGSATLNVLQGMRVFFQNAEQWKDFGTIYELRTLSQGKFAPLEKGKQYYLYNVGTGYYVTHGEAWGTQAIVADTESPMRFEFKQTASMADGVYYLSSKDYPTSGNILFRTKTDRNVGSGVKACFVDGGTTKLTATGRPAYWDVQLVEGQTNVYTIQPSTTSSENIEGEYLGVQPDHASSASYPTYGTYYDISYADYPQNCHWMLVEYNGDAELLNIYTSQLANLLSIAATKRVNTLSEQAVYDDFNSTLEDIQKACRRLRKKLNFINFQDEAFRDYIVSKYDIDGDKEISSTEAANILDMGAEALSRNTSLTTLDDLKYLSNLSVVNNNTFLSCTQVLDATLPNSVTALYYNAFQGCTKLEKIVLSSSLEDIGDRAFYNCRALKEIYLPVADPSYILLGNNIFYGVNKEECVLYVPRGTRDLYAAAEQWKDFTNIQEMRTVELPDFSEAEPNKNVYIYNLGLHRSISKGEAWGTQAVVNQKGMVYQLRVANASAGTYYLCNMELGTNNYLFRTESDDKVGSGVKTCFVDGSTDKSRDWVLAPVEGQTNVYTLQTPQNNASYVEGEYLGVDFQHASNFSTDYGGTYGLYWDIKYADNPEGCQWAFITEDDVEAANAFYELTQQLKQLLATAAATEGVDVSAEQAVYDNFGSSREAVEGAIASLREKLNLIAFTDARAKELCVNTWDDNEDDEISLDEAAAVTDLSIVFKLAGSSLKGLEDLRYFTSLTEVTDEAFRQNAYLYSAILPESVTSIGQNVFTSCGKFKYLALLNPSQVVTTNSSGLPSRDLIVFVPAGMIDAYKADDVWGKYEILEFTGTPTITADAASRQYGRTNVRLTYTVTGAPINGEPALSTNVEATAPAATYPIEVGTAGITSLGLQCVNGVLTVERAPVTVTAKSYTRNINEANPDFELTYSTLRNREKIQDVLTQQPTISCDATIDSPAGTYEIRASGAEADNYEFTYVNGVLTVIDPNNPDGINGVNANGQQQRLYDLSGLKVNNPQRGVYIDETGKKVVKQ
ncbi:MAG: C10 family peptidase [Bacteroidales bacterium]|nr:C10 family peptidase [Bacteroidales bacterium]